MDHHEVSNLVGADLSAKLLNVSLIGEFLGKELIISDAIVAVIDDTCQLNRAIANRLGLIGFYLLITILFEIKLLLILLF